MRLTSKEQAEAFVFFMLNEKNRHQDDIDQIERTVERVCIAYNIKRPYLDPKEKYWVVVDDAEVARGAVLAGVEIHDDDGCTD